jgi:hypothetical protein
MWVKGQTHGVAFVADDLGAWLVGLLADAGRKKLITLVLGTDQERALYQAATAAIQLAAAELASSGGQQPEQLTMVVSEVFRAPAPEPAMAAQATLLQALQAGIAAQLAVLDDPAVTGAGRSSAEVLGVPDGVLAKTLADHLVRQITLRGARGGPLAPLADQLNHDVTHLQAQRLEGMLAGLASQVTALTQAGSVSAMPGIPVRLPPRSAFLAGREELLAALDARLARGDGNGPRMIALHGLGGAGKTSVALEYAHRQLGEVRVAWQLPAGDPAVLAAGFGELAAQLEAQDLTGARDPVASVHRLLATSPWQWLLLFDDCPSLASVQQFLPPAGPGQVLITSRNALWPRAQAMEVPVLDLEAATGLLVDRTADLNWRAARELADELGGLPLALEQAGAYVQAVGGSLADYLTLFRKRRHDLLSRGEPAGYSQTVATTWALAFARLQQSAPGAVGLLRLLGFCASEAAPLRILLQPRPEITGQLSPQVAPVLLPLLEDELAAGDAIAALRWYSLVRPAGDGAISVHRLVQAVTTDQMPVELAKAWRQATAAVIGAAIPGDTQQPENWPVCAALLPHAQAALADDTSAMARLANYLGWIGSYSAALDIQRRVLEGRERSLGPEHPETLDARGDLAYWTGEAGDAGRARDQYAALLPVYERVLGPEHMDTLIIRSNLARWTGDAGDASGARDQLSGLLPAIERMLGPEHPDTLKVRANLAAWTGDAGDAAGARDQCAALLPAIEHALGPDHPDTLRARANLAFWTGEAGDAAGARDQYAALLPVTERVMGPEHPDTLKARANIANWSGRAGDASMAGDQLLALLPVIERVMGPEHPDTLNARRNHAKWVQERPDAARGGAARLRGALPGQERQLLGHRLHVLRPGSQVQRCRSSLYHVRVLSRPGTCSGRLADVQDVGLAVASGLCQPGRRPGHHQDRQRGDIGCQAARLDPRCLLLRAGRAVGDAARAQAPQATAADAPQPRRSGRRRGSVRYGHRRRSPAADGLAFHQPVADAAPAIGPPSEDPLDRIAKLAQLRDSGACCRAPSSGPIFDSAPSPSPARPGSPSESRCNDLGPQLVSLLAVQVVEDGQRLLPGQPGGGEVSRSLVGVA